MPGFAAKILVADDQPELLDAIALICSGEGYQTFAVSSPEEALSKLRNEEFDLLLMDMNYRPDRVTGKDGLDLLREVRRLDPRLPVVVMTAYGSISLAIQAIQAGAKDFVEKPWENERLLSIIRTQVELSGALRKQEQLEAQNRALRAMHSAPDEWIASSPGMVEIDRLIHQIAPANVNVLITGENGTGKSVIARRLHQLSQRSGQPFVNVNMGGIPETLFESEMFGHIKGAFTDARNDRVGRFELADGGTLFLDEIGNMTAGQQAKVLRVLETGEYERIGSSKTRITDARIISATNADLPKAILEGRFREDLYFRLNTISIHLPSLRQRLEDLPRLVTIFLEELAARYHKPQPSLSGEAWNTLRGHRWPGNIRELRHVIERAVLLSPVPEIQAHDLGLPADAARNVPVEDMDLEAMEAHLIRKTLSRYAGNALSAAKALGLSRSAFYRRLQKYRITGSL